MTFSSPAVATSHYLGKTHAKNMKQQSPKVEGMTAAASCCTEGLFKLKTRSEVLLDSQV